jgi:cytochrome c oxidase subunit II
MKNLLFLLIVLGVLGGGYLYMKKTPPPVSAVPVPTMATTPVVEQTATKPGAVKEFTVEGGMYYFNPKEIRVKVGDTVKITLTNKEGMHDFVLDEFNAKTKRIKAGETDTVTFVASKKGTFEYYCSVGTHRAMGMKGNLIVE